MITISRTIKRIKVEELNAEINRIFNEYAQDLKSVSKEVIHEYAKVLRDEVEGATPVSNRMSKHLKDGWKVTEETFTGGFEIKAFIHNTKKPGLVHLLELGTVKMSPRPMLVPAFNKVAPKIEQALANKITKI